jgi:hypothetical protein
VIKDLIIKYFRGQPLNIDECVKLMEAYMVKIGKTDPDFISKIIDPMNPFGQHMLQQAVDSSARLLSEDYSITKVFSEEGNLLMIY